MIKANSNIEIRNSKFEILNKSEYRNMKYETKKNQRPSVFIRGSLFLLTTFSQEKKCDNYI